MGGVPDRAQTLRQGGSPLQYQKALFASSLQGLWHWRCSEARRASHDALLSTRLFGCRTSFRDSVPAFCFKEKIVHSCSAGCFSHTQVLASIMCFGALLLPLVSRGQKCCAALKANHGCLNQELSTAHQHFRIQMPLY